MAQGWTEEEGEGRGTCSIFSLTQGTLPRWQWATQVARVAHLGIIGAFRSLASSGSSSGQSWEQLSQGKGTLQCLTHRHCWDTGSRSRSSEGPWEVLFRQSFVKAKLEAEKLRPLWLMSELWNFVQPERRLT